MPLRAAQLFVRSDSLDALAEALGAALAASQRALGQPSSGEARRGLAMVAGGWGAICLDAMDHGLARALASRIAGPVLALDLDGSRLWLETATFDPGATLAAGAGTETREDGAPREEATTASDLRDAEAAAWTLLDELGIPPALRLLALASIETVDADHAEALPAVLFEAREDATEVWPAGAVPPERTSELPVEPDLIVESAAGEARALEVRRLSGLAATPELAAALAAIEEAQARRIARALAAVSDGERVPLPAFTYDFAQAHELWPLLQQARAQRPWLRAALAQAPLTHAGFTALCKGALERELPAAPIARSHALCIELANGLRAQLAEPFDDYLGSLDEALAADALVASVLARLARPATPVSARPPAQVLAQLLPVVAGPALEEGRAQAEVAGSLRAALVLDDGESVLPVLSADLAALGLDEEAAFEEAVATLDARTLAAPGGLTWFDLDHGRVVVSDFADPAGASRLLTPLGRELILQILGAPSCLGAAPTRDTLLACEGDDPDAVAWLREEAQRRFEEGPFPVDPGIVRLTEEGVDAVAGHWELQSGLEQEGEE